MWTLSRFPHMDPRPTRKLRVSVVQACCQKYEIDATLEKLEQLTRLAKDRDGAQLAVFPEALYVCYLF